MKIGLKALRINANLTQEDAARQMGVSKVTLMHWENYDTSPTAVQLMSLCKLYGCEIGDIFLPDKLAKS